MRIIKAHDNIYAIIAGEMLNIESSALHFIDGIPVEKVPGYPKIVDGSTVYVIKATTGYLFVPAGIDLDEFEEELMGQVLKLETGRIPGNLCQYQTIDMGFNTNVKIKSSQVLSRTSSEQPQKAGRRRAGYMPTDTKNVRRLFVRGDDTRRARFTWIIRPISSIEYDITSSNMTDAIAQHGCSIFYDADNICNLGHNEVTFTFCRDNLKGSERILSEKLILCRYGNPLSVELSSYWRDNHLPNCRNIVKQVFSCDYTQLQIRPVKLSDADGDVTPDVCSTCRSILFDDNYVLAGHILDIDCPEWVAKCPLCVHTTSADKPIERKYFRVFRVTFPRTQEHVMDAHDITEQRRDIFREVNRGTREVSMMTNDKPISCTLIGDKYVAFDGGADNFLYTRLSVHPDFLGRKVLHEFKWVG